MAQNLTDEYRKFRYYEGVCSSSDFIKEIAKVLSLGVKSEPVKDADDNIITPAQPYKIKNWDIVYPLVSKDFPEYERLNSRDKYLGLTVNDSEENKNDGVDNLGEDRRIAKLENQIAQITDRVVLRTTTTPKEISESEVDDLSVSGETDQASTTMYVQFWKPKYLANPEEYPIDAEMYGLTPQLITRDMYKEARKSTTSVIYDLALLADDTNCKQDRTKGLVTKSLSEEYVDAVSEAYTHEYLFDETIGVLQGLVSIFGVSFLSQVIDEPTESSRVTSCILNRANLNNIKQTNETLYKFLFDICGLRTTFTGEDYDLINEMKLMITAVGTTGAISYYVTLSFKKKVEIYSIATKKNISGEYIKVLDVEGEYGHVSLDYIKPELYSEGRYVPLPDKYTTDDSKSNVTFNPDEPIRFCLDKVTDESVLYGTVVIRFDYDKNLDYTDISSLKITDSVALENNHYCLVRMFDNPNIDFSGPEPNIVDAKGNITATNSHTSPWSKLSWYQDFEEIMMDHIDEDISVSSITDGTLLVPLETSGLTSDTRISYWVNTNNDRFSLIVMGNPALDYERDRHLISSCYVGRIESFDNSINDVSGNFALYTSSSTTPCKTVMTAHDTQYHINRDFQNEYFKEDAVPMSTVSSFNDKYSEYSEDRAGNIQAYKDYCEKIGGKQNISKIGANNFDIYYVTITGNKFFNENEMPCYMILDENDEPVFLKNDPSTGEAVYYTQVAYRDFIYGSSDSRSNQIMIYVPRLTNSNENYTIYFNFGYYEEKFVINSGVTRDAFGNVIGIETIDDYGKNTSDGVTSVSMYHTRSKAFYQKHHFLFATTEEYMSKVMYGKSSYTGEYYADRIKITHGNDGPRGILSDTLVIDSSSLYPKDELVINKDFSKSKDELEETFTYFPITAPYSPLSDGPNARYGIALKKAEVEPEYQDNKKILNIARNELNTIMVNNQVVKEDTILPSKTSSGCLIYWNISEDIDTNWIEADSSTSGAQKITRTFADGTTKIFSGKICNANNADIVVDGFKKGTGLNNPVKADFDIARGTSKTVNFCSNVTLTPDGGTLTVDNSVNAIYYGYSDTPLTTMTGDTKLTCIMDDGTDFNNIHEYAYYEMFADMKHPFEITTPGTVSAMTKNIYNAHPLKYLNLFFVANSEEVAGVLNESTNVYDKIIKTYATIPLHYEDWETAEYEEDKTLFGLLQYPCCLTAYVTNVTNSNSQGILYNSAIYSRYDFSYVPYNENYQIRVQNMNGDVNIYGANHAGFTDVIDNHDGARITIPAADILDDLYINISAR